VTAALLFVACYWFLRVLVTMARLRARPWTLGPGDDAGIARDVASVSVCVPARNEEKAIGACVRSILHQDLPFPKERLDLIVLDDRSEDATADAALAAGAGDARLRVLPGTGPPPGWFGKHHALWEATRWAKGEWLLFVDADVVLHPRALAVALAFARERDLHMLSWLGSLDCRTFWERVALPFVGDIIYLSAPANAVNDPRSDQCLANGQFILIRRDVYDAVGGHEAIRNSVVDDVSLSRLVKFHPGQPWRYRLVYAHELMSVRMYDSLQAIWRGFTKNFYAGAQGRGGLLLLTVGYILLTSVFPWLSLGIGHPAAVPAVLLTVLFRSLVRRLNPIPWPYVLLHPLGAVVTVGIILDSLLQGWGIRQRVGWKGRATP
jgi:glycosyltransferase involved in cell wall biosynthesis